MHVCQCSIERTMITPTPQCRIDWSYTWFTNQKQNWKLFDHLKRRKIWLWKFQKNFRRTKVTDVQSYSYPKLGCVVRIDSTLSRADRRPNDHRKSALRFIFWKLALVWISTFALIIVRRFLLSFCFLKLSKDVFGILKLSNIEPFWAKSRCKA